MRQENERQGPLQVPDGLAWKVDWSHDDQRNASLK